MKKEEGRKKHNNKIYQSKKQKSNHSDIRFNIDIDRPDHEAEQTIYLSHNVQYTIKYSAASGHSLSYADYIFFVPQSVMTCPESGPTEEGGLDHGGYLTESLTVTLRLRAIGEDYVLCLRQGGLDGSNRIAMHRHIRAVVSFDPPSQPPSAPFIAPPLKQFPEMPPQMLPPMLPPMLPLQSRLGETHHITFLIH